MFNPGIHQCIRPGSCAPSPTPRPFPSKRRFRAPPVGKRNVGYRISWIAIRAKSADPILGYLRLRRTEEREVIPDSPYSAISLPSGWELVYTNEPLMFIDKGLLEHVSAEHDIVACYVNETVMFSLAVECRNAEMVWGVRHDASQGIDDIVTEGKVPKQYDEIWRRLEADRAARRGGQRIDFMFDLPVELAATITGFQHDRIPAEWGAAPFVVLKPIGKGPYGVLKR